MIKGVIFDLDGVIVSTDEYHFQAWKLLASKIGVSFSRSDNERLRGVSRMESLDLVLNGARARYSDQEKLDMAESKNAMYRELLVRISPDEILPGVVNCLNQLKSRGVKVAIGSSSKNAAYILRAIGLDGSFDTVVDGTHIKRSKPDPEVFTLAAKQLGLEPEQCLVVEDADAGIEAAIAANMAVLGVGAAAGNPAATLQAKDLDAITVSEMLDAHQARAGRRGASSAHTRAAEVDAFVEDLLSKLTLEEKVSLCHASSKFSTNPIPRFGVPELKMSDGPHGVRHEISKTRWEPAGVDDDYATYLPCGTAQAATWSREMMARCGSVLGAEARHRGKDVILGPGINLIRTPLCGRNFEYYSEDPYLISELVVPAVRAIQAEDVAACVKHFAANNQELNRFKTDVEMDEYVLREMYLPGFEAAVKAGGVLAVMGAYNGFRGQCCCHNDYLVNGILKDEWGFKGAYISDWAGAKTTDEAVLGGLDIEMGTEGAFEDYYLAKPFLEGLRTGKYPVSVLDDKVRRVLHVMYLSGMFDPNRKAGARNTREHQLVALDAARESVVLLKNEEAVLPLDPKQISKLLVVGENAELKHGSGGNSSAVKTPYEVSPLEGIRQLLGDAAEVMYVKGYPDDRDGFTAIPTQYLGTADEGSGVKGWKSYFYNGREFLGESLVEYAENAAYESLYDSLPTGVHRQNFSVSWKTEVTAPEEGVYQFGFNSDGLATLFLNGAKVCETDRDAHRHVERAEVSLKKGEVLPLELRFAMSDNATYVKFGWLCPQAQSSAASKGLSTREEALRLAAEVDAVVFIGGLTHMHDIEGRDRKDLKLPDGQDELIEELLAVNPNVVTCIVAGSAVAMPWVDRAKSIVWMSYAGMECGNALADVLFGRVNPSGKLPFTFPNSKEEIAVHHEPERYHADCSRYSEGLMVGYRYYTIRNMKPLYCFGHGLSYTRFELSNLRHEYAEEARVYQVALTVENTGPVPGKEVIQLYLERGQGDETRPRIELKGFEKVSLNPGEEKEVRFQLTDKELDYYSSELQTWVSHLDAFTVHVGTSSEVLPLTVVISPRPKTEELMSSGDISAACPQ